MRKAQKKALTPEQAQALDVFKEKHGDKWKDKLSDCWMSAGYPNIPDEHAAQLQRIRNQFGPSWLVNYEG